MRTCIHFIHITKACPLMAECSQLRRIQTPGPIRARRTCDALSAHIQLPSQLSKLPLLLLSFHSRGWLDKQVSDSDCLALTSDSPALVPKTLRKSVMGRRILSQTKRIIKGNGTGRTGVTKSASGSCHVNMDKFLKNTDAWFNHELLGIIFSSHNCIKIFQRPCKQRLLWKSIF